MSNDLFSPLSKRVSDDDFLFICSSAISVTKRQIVCKNLPNGKITITSWSIVTPSLGRQAQFSAAFRPFGLRKVWRSFFVSHLVLSFSIGADRSLKYEIDTPLDLEAPKMHFQHFWCVLVFIFKYLNILKYFLDKYVMLKYLWSVAHRIPFICYWEYANYWERVSN